MQVCEFYKIQNTNLITPEILKASFIFMYFSWLGFKCEWATVKDEQLWIGSTGILVRKKDEDDSTFDKTRQSVKIVSPNGKITDMDWSDKYEKITDALGIKETGNNKRL